jgi:hypothetical protein
MEGFGGGTPFRMWRGGPRSRQSQGQLRSASDKPRLKSRPHTADPTASLHRGTILRKRPASESANIPSELTSCFFPLPDLEILCLHLLLITSHPLRVAVTTLAYNGRTAALRRAGRRRYGGGRGSRQGICPFLRIKRSQRCCQRPRGFFQGRGELWKGKRPSAYFLLGQMRGRC